MTFLPKALRFEQEEMVAAILAADMSWKPLFCVMHNTAAPSLKNWLSYTLAQKLAWPDNLNRYYKNMGWHCFSGDTKFHTSYGLKTFKECAGKNVDVLTPAGYFSAPIKKFGKQKLYRVQLVQVTPRTSNNRVWYSPSGSTPVEIRVTKNHHWPLLDGSLTNNLKVGDLIPNGTYIPDKDSEEFLQGIRHGFIYGDGWIEKKRNSITYAAGVHGRKSEILQYFTDSETHFFPSRAKRERTYKGTVMVKCDRNLKELPDLSDHLDHLAGFIQGWCIADANVKRNTTHKICNADREVLEWLHRVSPYMGVNVAASHAITEDIHGPGAYKEGSCYTTHVRMSDRPWKVQSITEECTEEVYCAVLPNSDKLFILEHGILTHNSGPHFAACPETWSAQLCDIGADGVHCSCWNHFSWGVETVIDAASEDPNSGPGLQAVNNAINIIAALHVKMDWDPADYEYGVKGLHFHEECKADNHACPGSQIHKPDIVARVQKRMAEIRLAHNRPAPTPLPADNLGPADTPMPPTIEINPWPTMEARPDFFKVAARTFNKWKQIGVSNPFALGSLGNVEAECSFNLAVSGDKHSAYGAGQWHEDRCEVMAKATGIDPRKSPPPPIEAQIDVMWWELNNTEKKALAKIEACTTALAAGAAFCTYFERAGAPGQAAKRGAMSERWADFLSTDEGKKLLADNPAQPYTL